jgi:hypothetical protein
MDSNDSLDRTLAPLVPSFPDYNVDSLREILQANGNDVSAAISMLDGQKGQDGVETCRSSPVYQAGPLWTTKIFGQNRPLFLVACESRDHY